MKKITDAGMMSNLSEREKVLTANRAYHSVMAEKYESDQPYFSDENKTRVKKIIDMCCIKSGNEMLVDLGCGTGFIISVAEPLFDSIVGVDMTPEMTEQIKIRDAEKVKILIEQIEKTSLPDECSNVVTAYGVLHHVYDLQPVFEEIFRILKPGGFFYADQDPNSDYLTRMKEIVVDKMTMKNPILAREMRSSVFTAENQEEMYGISKDVTTYSEYWKCKKNGLSHDNLIAMLQAIGFNNIDIVYEWFIGEGFARNQHGHEFADKMVETLRAALPFTRSLFKYMSIRAEKPSLE